MHSKNHNDREINFADNWAWVFSVITFLTFGEAQTIGGIVPNLIAFILFHGVIGYFSLTGKMAEMFSIKKRPNQTSLGLVDSRLVSETP